MSMPKLRDERLAWLAVRDELHKRSRSGLATFIGFFAGAGVGVRGAARLSSDLHKEQLTSKMMRYAIAVDQMALRLTKDEREHLRATGQVPAWFLERVIAEAKTVKLR